MHNKQQIQPTNSQDSAAADTRKSWVTPDVSESPINELTKLGTTAGADGDFYS